LLELNGENVFNWRGSYFRDHVLNSVRWCGAVASLRKKMDSATQVLAIKLIIIYLLQNFAFGHWRQVEDNGYGLYNIVDAFFVSFTSKSCN